MDHYSRIRSKISIGPIESCWPLALLEFATHWATDHAKCTGRIGFNTDQLIHFACKVLWAFIVVLAAGASQPWA